MVTKQDKQDKKQIEVDKNLRNDQSQIEQWDVLKQQYGQANGELIDTPFQIHKKLFGVEKKLIKPNEPMLLLQKKDGSTEFYEGVTQGVFDYKGSDGLPKKVWISKKFLWSMNWGNDTVKYYNCLEDSFIPAGTTNTLIEFEELKKILDKQALNHEKLKTAELKARGDLFMDIAKGIALLIFAVGGVLAGSAMLGYPLADLFFGGGVDEVVKEVAKNATVNVPITSINTP